MLTLANRASFATLLDLVRYQVEHRADHPALIFIPANGTPTQTITTAELFIGAAQYSATLKAVGIGPRDLVILVLEHSTDLVFAFWGALLIGAIPSIFPFLSDKLDPAMYFERVETLIAQAGVKAVIVAEAFHGPLAARLAPHGVSVLGVSALVASNADNLPAWETKIEGEDIAFLQHSSGTTGLQKGVALSHRAVLNQLAAYGAAIDLRPTDIVASWLPLYHDMGLIAGFVMPIAQGIPLVLMSPFHWVRDPKLLLWAIHKHQATLCWLPNFAYNFLATRVRDSVIEGVRLESLRAVINCSEPMQAESHRIFAERFAPYGFAESALATCYAMAENTFAVTQGGIGQGGIERPVTIDRISRAALAANRAILAQPADLSIEMLSCGRPLTHCEVKIVDPHGVTLSERYVGEVLLRSDSMLTGYHHRNDLTAQVLREGWYWTGDYGYLADGELYITGRKKDLIIVGGRNIYPQDLEAIAGAVAGVHPGRAVAFGVADERLGTEAIVIVVEANTADDEARTVIERQIRQQITQQTDQVVGRVAVKPRMWLSKTSSGKIQRSAIREKYLRELEAGSDAE